MQVKNPTCKDIVMQEKYVAFSMFLNEIAKNPLSLVLGIFFSFKKCRSCLQKVNSPLDAQHDEF